MFDRHSRTSAPLVKNGRIFLRAHERLLAVDAYNGTLLWDRAEPGLNDRVNVPRDSGYSAVDDDFYYTAVGGKCWRIDVATGERASTMRLPAEAGSKDYDWGHVALEGDLIGVHSASTAESLKSLCISPSTPSWLAASWPVNPGASLLC